MQSQLLLGNSTIQNGISSFDCFRSRKEPIDTFTFSFRQGLKIQVEQQTQADFFVGMPGQEPKKVFRGYVDRTSSPYRARDKMADLMQPVNQAFNNTLPQEVLNYVLQRAGIGGAVLPPESFRRKNFVASAPSFFDLILQVNKYWGVDYSGYFDLESRFHWHRHEEPERMPVFAYGENIIRMDFDGQKGSFLTILMPEVDHSQLIGMEHPQVPADEVLVDAVHHFTNDQGGLRTEIYFSLL